LLRLIDVIVEQLQDLKFGNHKKAGKEIMEEVVSTWLIRGYKKQFNEYMEIKNNWRGDDEEVLTDEELYDRKEEKVSEEKENAEIFRIETDIFDFETPLCKAFKKFNHPFQIDVDVLTGDLTGLKTYEDYKDAPYHFKNGHSEWPTCNWKEDGNCNGENLPGMIRIGDMTWFQNYEWNIGRERRKKKKNQDHAGMTNDDAIQGDHEWFDEHEPMEDDDDINDLDDYLIMNYASYFVDEEKERSKEIRCKLLGIPYVKPQACKYEKFEVIKYSFGPAEEYVAIKEYEYDIWLRTKENVSQVFKEIFRKKDEGWSITHPYPPLDVSKPITYTIGSDLEGSIYYTISGTPGSTARNNSNCEPCLIKEVNQALDDKSWVEAMQEELLEFKLLNVWTLVDLPHGKRAIGTKWVYRNKRDQRGIIVRNKAKLVAQDHRQEEGIDYDEVFAPVARIEAIRLFLAYASFMDFTVYQMDVKSEFLYGTIEEKVYVSQPLGFVDQQFPDKVYKVEKALYGLHQAPRAWLNIMFAVLVLIKKSTTGGCQFLGSRLISWQCKKQTIVANSITEAEYTVASSWCGQVLWLQNQLLNYGYNFMQTKIHVDNESAICVVKHLVYHSKTKHIKIRHHFIRDSYEKRLIEMVKIHIDSNVVDLLNKAFDLTRFQFLVASIGNVTPIFDTMLVQHQAPEGEDEDVNSKEGDSVEREMPKVDIPQGIDTGGKPRRQETMGGTSAQTWSERVLEQPNEPPLTEGHASGSGEGRLEENIKLTNIIPTPHDLPLMGGYTPGSDDGRITLAELMETCTILSNRVTQLETKLSTTKVVYSKSFITLTNRVKKLESQLKQKRSTAVIHSSNEKRTKCAH
nr:retrovirus-related Pol polyprotein from transposon TNT 1-94 [Tanacetum cinerariifolium]